MALIHLSRGQITFEASYKDITEELFGPGDDRRSTARKRIQSIENHQCAYGLELIVRTQMGNRIEGTNGYEFLPTLYEWKLISGIVSALYREDFGLVESEIERLGRVPIKAISISQSKKLSPFNQDRKDLRTAKTKLLKLARNEVEKGRDPWKMIGRMFEEINSKTKELQESENEERARLQFIERFEIESLFSSISSRRSQSYERAEGVHLLSSINHAPAVETELNKNQRQEYTGIEIVRKEKVSL